MTLSTNQLPVSPRLAFLLINAGIIVGLGVLYLSPKPLHYVAICGAVQFLWFNTLLLYKIRKDRAQTRTTL